MIATYNVHWKFIASEQVSIAFQPLAKFIMYVWRVNKLSQSPLNGIFYSVYIM